MSDKAELEITVTLKLRGVTIEGMSIEEVRDLRDALNELVDEAEPEQTTWPQIPYYPHMPSYPYTTDKIYTITSNGASTYATTN